jgi:hypothetical protein
MQEDQGPAQAITANELDDASAFYFRETGCSIAKNGLSYEELTSNRKVV